MTTINVKQHHIDKGWLCECRDCPIAQAVNEVLKQDHYAEVNRQNIAICNNLNSIILESPTSVSKFVEEFDNGLHVSPFSFELDLPVEVLK